VPYIKPTEAEVAAREALMQEIAAATAAAMENPWSRQTATFIDEPKQPQQEAS
jgi:hypothetical protein